MLGRRLLVLPLIGVGGGLATTHSSLPQVHAASSDGPSSHPTSPPVSHAAPPPADAKKAVRACELPIYGDPEPAQFEVVVEEPSMYRTAVSDARKWVWTYKDSIQSASRQVGDAVHTVKKAGVDGLEYIQKDSGALPRAVVISVAGLGGIVAGYRGGRLRKMLYASLAMGGAAAVCYPREAADISRRGWTSVSELGMAAYRDNISPGPSPPAAAAQKGKSPAPVGSASPHASDKPANPPAPSPSPSKGGVDGKAADHAKGGGQGSEANPAKKDFGMTNPKDADMYTTRGK